jgi:hypothetical protein
MFVRQIGLAIVASTIAVSATLSYAQSIPVTPLEPDAQISNQLTTAQIDALAYLIRSHGYSCSSISSARPFLWSSGFKVYCNQYSYGYDIEDRGGNWVVTYN